MSAKINRNISPFYMELAKKTLSENPSHIPAHLTALKRWLCSCPHLTVPDNDVFLLGFLRYAHYDHSTAQKRIDNFCSMRCLSKHGIAEWYIYPKLTDPLVDEYLDAGILLPLGTVDSGVHMFLLRLSKFYFSLKQTNKLFNYYEKIYLFSEATPGRTKYLIMYKESKAFNVAFKFFEFWLSDKMRQRILRIKDDTDKAFKKIPGLKNIMPREYGGDNGSLQDIIAADKEDFKKFYSRTSCLNGIKVDESKRPPSAQNYMREYNDIDGILMGNQGTFIPINPDD
ncbi:hypothetical protein MN116_006368 [Schistosoma mekongi]|uniref:CRAL-TRIO domain-containing protein n=1 Tax=Schistosoma mekongi TaxID=38744 RepID=A0AAE1ZBF8_SCHME|nr:hypothetical protein MN116_006368 [Schistosoma mekongi]